jgi:hypothetical protein
MTPLSWSQRAAVKKFYEGVEQLLKIFQFDLQEGSLIYADKAYNDYDLEDALIEAAHIQLCPIRKKNSKRTVPLYLSYVRHYYRKMIETVGSLIERILPKTIHGSLPRALS